MKKLKPTPRLREDAREGDLVRLQLRNKQECVGVYHPVGTESYAFIGPVTFSSVLNTNVRVYASEFKIVGSSGFEQTVLGYEILRRRKVESAPSVR